MRATIDKAGRVVIPKPLRDQVGLTPGEVELVADGTGVRIEPVTGTEVIERHGRLIIPETGSQITQAAVDALRRADQR
jgi:AbrB family looped-hinge helix DNA binding protein